MVFDVKPSELAVVEALVEINEDAVMLEIRAVMFEQEQKT